VNERHRRFIRLLKDIDTVLFDFDGVLADSEDHYFLSYRKGFRKYGHELDRDEYLTWWTLKGAGIEGECRRKHLRLSPAEKADIMSERIRSYSRYCRTGKISIIPAAFDSLVRLRRLGFKTAIASNSFPDDLSSVFKSNRKKPGVPVVGRMKGLRTKPQPDVFLYAAGLLQSEPTRCLVIEDAGKGLEAAKACGMKCAIIRTPATSKVRFDAADIVFDSAGDFLSAVRNLSPRRKS
jgi:beta-phosphoglucomutase-like phosphatase (HAD superfamily)